jgi:hypothetical protein
MQDGNVVKDGDTVGVPGNERIETMCQPVGRRCPQLFFDEP